MHTVKVVSTAFGLLAMCVLIGGIADGRRGRRQGAVAFLPIWLAGTGLNLYSGVKDAGYSVSEELPIAAGVFAGPVLTALALRARLGQKE